METITLPGGAQDKTEAAHYLSPPPRGSCFPPIVIALLSIHACLLAWAAYRDSAVWDEVGHFAAGLSHWDTGTFHLYNVNPPLIRGIACAPVALWMDPKGEINQSYSRFDLTRPEFQIGSQIAAANGARYFWLITIARWTCIPLSLLGGWICFLWARDLYGQASGYLALILWTFSPTVLAYGHLIAPDLGAAALGVAASYLLWRWLRRSTLTRAAAAGVVLGLAELAKSTWIILFLLWPLLWMGFRLLDSSRPAAREWFRQAVQLCLTLFIALWVMNLGYGFEGSFKPLREYRFASALFGGGEVDQLSNDSASLNRFRQSWMGHLRVPLPENYLLGIDRQRRDFEDKLWSFLNGEWRLGGWWYYYLYALLIKEPLGTWGLLLLALGVTAWFRKLYAPSTRDDFLLIVPVLAVLGLISSQTGFSHHVRYALPILPFVFIWISKLGASSRVGHIWVRRSAILLLAWSVVSSLLVFPHSLSYFNELVGGPCNGTYHLAHSNTDWGQDLLYLSAWVRSHPEAQPLQLAYDLPFIDPRLAGINWKPPPAGPDSMAASTSAQSDLGPQPGWYAISVNHLHGRSRRFSYFEHFRPVDRIGYSIRIYHITFADANEARARLGLNPLEEE